MTYKEVSINALRGLTFQKVERERNKLYFRGDKNYLFYHSQDCCETVEIEEVIGDLSDLEGTPILLAEEVTNREDGADGMSLTWTFYKFGTIKGHVTVRWRGESNGYYSEHVDLVEFVKEE